MSTVNTTKSTGKDSQKKYLNLIHNIQQSLNSVQDLDVLRKNYRNWIKKIIPFRCIALLQFDSQVDKHEIFDVYPKTFQPLVAHQLEEGIIQWAGRRRKLFFTNNGMLQNIMKTDKVLFVPLAKNGFYAGLLEIVPKRKFSEDEDKDYHVLLKTISSLFAAHFECLYLQNRLDKMDSFYNKINYQIQNIDKLSSLGELAGSIAHEINNPMTVILGRLQLILRDNSLSGKLKPKLQKIENEAKRIAELLHELLSFSRSNNQKKLNESVQVNDVVEKSLRLTKHNFKLNHYDIDTRLSSGLPEIWGNSVQLQQVLNNLIINAKHAMGESGSLMIRTYAEQNNVIITVTDDGCGIKSQHLPQIFEPFYTNKPDKGGTGLGLSICRKIVDNHNGELSVESKEGEGTTFTILIPAINR